MKPFLTAPRTVIPPPCSLALGETYNLLRVFDPCALPPAVLSAPRMLAFCSPVAGRKGAFLARSFCQGEACQSPGKTSGNTKLSSFSPSPLLWFSIISFRMSSMVPSFGNKRGSTGVTAGYCDSASVSSGRILERGGFVSETQDVSRLGEEGESLRSQE